MDRFADPELLKAAVCMVDDLYKFINDIVIMDNALLDYLAASCLTFTTALRERGYVIHYVVENQFSDIDFIKLGPCDLFPKVMNGAGFVYACPHHMALTLMPADGSEPSDYETRYVADRMVSNCQEKGLHYVFLEADYEEGTLDTALRSHGSPGVLSVFRNDQPIPGSDITVAFPQQKLEG